MARGRSDSGGVSLSGCDASRGQGCGNSRVEEARNMAQQIADPAAKRHMQDIAANCEKVAKRVEAQLGGEQSFSRRFCEATTSQVLLVS